MAVGLMAVGVIAVGMVTGMSNCKIQNIVKLQEPENYWIVVKMFPTSPGSGTVGVMAHGYWVMTVGGWHTGSDSGVMSHR